MTNYYWKDIKDVDCYETKSKLLLEKGLELNNTYNIHPGGFIHLPKSTVRWRSFLGNDYQMVDFLFAPG